MLQRVQRRPDGERKSRTVSYYAPRRPGSSRWREKSRTISYHVPRRSTLSRERGSRTVGYHAPWRPGSSRWSEREQNCKLLCSKASRVIPMERERERVRLLVIMLQDVQDHPDGERKKEREQDLSCYAPRRPTSSRWREREREQDCKLLCSKASRIIPM